MKTKLKENKKNNKVKSNGEVYMQEITKMMAMKKKKKQKNRKE